MLKVNTSIDITNETTITTTADMRRHTCVDIDECQAYGTHQCTQTCENEKGSYRCACASNYVDTHGDGSMCEAAWQEDAVVLIAHGAEIRQLRQNFSGYVYANLIEDASFVLGMDIDPVARHVYWIDEGTQQIKRSFIPVSKWALGHPQVLLGGVLEGGGGEYDFTALAVDWLAKNLYYAEGLHGTIRVCTADGRYSKTLINTRAERVYSLVVNPILG